MIKVCICNKSNDVSILRVVFMCCIRLSEWWLGVIAVVVNSVCRISEVTQRRARLVLGWMTGKASRYVISHAGQLSLAIRPRLGALQ